MTHLFAGIAVSDFAAACDWYERLFGSPPAFYPGEGEAVWHGVSSASVYVTADRGRAGKSLLTLAVRNLDVQRADLVQRDLPVEESAEHNGMRSLIAIDPDGNTVKFFEDPSQPVATPHNEVKRLPDPTTSLTRFVRAYERASNSHDISQVRPFLAPDAVYWFSDGSHRGRDAVLAAIAATFATIRDEIYEIGDLEWITHGARHAVCRYRFAWTGTIEGQHRSGTGRGTNVLVNSGGAWQILHEHLSA